MIGILDTIMTRRRKTPPPAIAQDRQGYVPRLQAGVRVDHDTALQFSVVWACVRIISETLASVPWRVHRHREDGGRDLIEGGVDDLLHRRPNPEMGAFEFRQAIMGHVLTWGNGYAEIERGSNGQIIALWLLPPDLVEPQRDERGKLVYVVRGLGGPNAVLRREDVLHFRGLGFDGIRGYSVIEMAARAIGLGLATERFGTDFFANGAHPSAAIEYPGTVDDDMADRMRKSLHEVSGPGKWMSPMLLESGTKWINTGLPQKDSQFLETRVFQVRDLSRIYRIPLHMLGDLADATFSNVENQKIEFVSGSIMPWAVRLEQEVDMKLLGRPIGGRRLFTRMNLAGLLRGDLESQNRAFATGVQWGWYSPNDVRRFFDLNPIFDKSGDEYLRPVNMVPASGDGADGQSIARALRADERFLELVKGEQGGCGARGESGSAGAPGEQGPRGMDGERGELGPQGISGDQGSIGDQGVAGEHGVAGDKGEPGERGADGSRGAQGELGEVGPCGPQGGQGEVGDRGEQGIEGEAGGAGQHGEPGDRGQRGERGEAGLQGPSGELGSRGERGEQGMPGNPGIVASVESRLNASACRDLLVAQLGRLVRREAARVDDLAKRCDGKPAKLQSRLTDLYDEHSKHMIEDLGRLVCSLAEIRGQLEGPLGGVLRSVVSGWVQERLSAAKGELADELADVVTERWRNERVSADADSLLERLRFVMPLSKAAQELNHGH